MTQRVCRGKRAPMGQGPFSVRQGAEGARRADRGEAREGFYPASELSGEIKLLLLLCVYIEFLLRSDERCLTERGCVLGASDCPTVQA